MKKAPYFAKYFPVREEIRDGDIWFCPKNGLSGRCPRNFAYFINNEHHIKMVLFLCTSDVDTGYKRIVCRISDGALGYVEEGDRFNINDILISEWGGSTDSHRVSIEIADNISIECSYALIKGPDKKFH